MLRDLKTDLVKLDDGYMHVYQLQWCSLIGTLHCRHIYNLNYTQSCQHWTGEGWWWWGGGGGQRGWNYWTNKII